MELSDRFIPFPLVLLAELYQTVYAYHTGYTVITPDTSHEVKV